MCDNMGKRWTEDEELYLVKCMETRLDDGRPATTELVWVLFNNHYKRTNPDKVERTFDAIKAKISKLNRATVKEEVPVKEIVKKTKKTRVIVKVGNAKMKWTPTDDMYLVRNWSANRGKRDEVAAHLQRTKKACENRLRRIESMPDYRNTLIAGKKMQPTQQDEIPTVTTKECDCCDGCINDIGMWGRFTLWRKTRKHLSIKRKALKLQKQLEALE